MTVNTSDQAGYLAPVSSPPAYDEALEREISQWIRAVSGLPEGMARPRWTDPQPAIPPLGTNWCGFGIVDFIEDANPASVSVSDDVEQQWQHETLVVLCCFYGPNGQATATRFRDGLRVPQNNAELNRTTLTYHSNTRIIPAPELINKQWQRRYDISVTLRRKVVREYGIKSLVDAPVSFFGD
ncbi:hypothetical protein FVB13_07920 [Escherichia coli]|uniref:phage neck terminator protein n=1 Tax=Escherichia coli TaxID=562 RepID=UPI00128DB997|nr:hypothetical protein [Escherichia coli]MPU29123.1 hypothetical protein [Escherichia coli]MPU39470.1 hypothetical protein [Escherichia coli]